MNTRPANNYEPIPQPRWDLQRRPTDPWGFRLVFSFENAAKLSFRSIDSPGGGRLKFSAWLG